MREPDNRLIQVLGDLRPLGRSLSYNLERNALFHAGKYERGLESSSAPASPARRGRVLRLLGRGNEALRAWSEAASSGSPAAEIHAWRWEMTAGRGSSSEIDRAVALEPGNAWWRSWRALGWLAAAKRNRSRDRSGARRALADVEAALSLDGRNPLAQAALALCRDFSGSPRAMLAPLERAIRREPREAWLRHFRADARLLLGDAEGFVSDTEEALYLDEGRGYWSKLLMDRGLSGGTFATEALIWKFPRRDRHAAYLIARADAFLAREPKAYWAYALRGNLKRDPEINDFDGARADLETAVELKPDCAWTRAYLSRARPASEALGTIGEAIRLRPDCGWLRVWRGEVRRRQEDFRGARADFDAGLALAPDYELGYSWRGGTLRRLGRLDEAVSDLSLAARLAPGHAWTLQELSLALRAAGKIPEALARLRAARRLDPKFGWGGPADDAASAARDLDRHLASRPDDAWAFAWRGEMKIRGGDFRGAREDLDAALRLDGGLAWARAWRGRALHELDRGREALADLRRAAKEAPESSDARAWLGFVLWKSGRLKEAAAELDRAARLDRKSSWIASWRGEVLLALGRPREARRALDAALALHPKNFAALLARAAASKALGSDAGARADLARARALAPGDRRARLALERLLADENDWAEQCESLLRAGRHEELAEVGGRGLKRYPRSSRLLSLRAEARRCLGEEERALADLNRLVVLNPGNAGALLSRGGGKLRVFDFSGALRDAEAALNLEPASARAWALVGEARRGMGRGREAVDGASRAIAAAPGWAWAYVVRAKARRAEDLPGALADARKAARIDPTDAKARGWQGEILRRLRRSREAARVLERAAALDPRCAWILCLRGEARRDVGRLREALVDVTAAVRMERTCSCAHDFLGAAAARPPRDAASAWVHAWRGAVHRKNGRWPEALADFDRAVRLDRRCFWALSWRGEARLARGELAAAVRDLRASLAIYSGDADALCWLGRALCGLGRCGPARAAFARALAERPDHVGALLGLGLCWRRSGDARRAEAPLRRAMDLSPGLFAAAGAGA